MSSTDDVLAAYAQGSSHNQIATATGVKVNSVRLLLFRARRRLAALRMSSR
jgi:DNA-directed RNA polymerase specialized sigma24 family protein